MDSLPIGTLEYLSNLTGLPKQHLSDYLNERRNMSKSRAINLENTTLKEGSFFTKENWMFRPGEIKAALVNSAHPVPSQDTRKVLETVN